MCKWYNKVYLQHNVLNECCVCSALFQLHCFPTKPKDPLNREKWIRLINRSKHTKLWSPKKGSRVCSLHFIDGMPTEENPYPTKNLGYNSEKKVLSITTFSENLAFTGRNKRKRTSSPVDHKIKKIMEIRLLSLMNSCCNS